MSRPPVIAVTLNSSPLDTVRSSRKVPPPGDVCSVLDHDHGFALGASPDGFALDTSQRSSTVTTNQATPTARNIRSAFLSPRRLLPSMWLVPRMITPAIATPLLSLLGLVSFFQSNTLKLHLHLPQGHEHVHGSALAVHLKPQFLSGP